MGTPPVNPGVMTPDQKAGLGARLGLDTPPPVTSGSGVVSGGLSTAADVLGDVRGALSSAYAEQRAVQEEARDVILASPQGSTATEGYHLEEQSDAINVDGHLNLGPVPAEPPRQPPEVRA